MFWDRIAGVYDVFSRMINRKACADLQEKVAGMIGMEDEVLECACGTGLLTGVIAEKCLRLIATDFSKEMLVQARKKFGQYKNVAFQQGNILDLEFADESFDVVVAANVIHLLDDPHQALREMFRVCRRGGRIIVPTYLNKYADQKPNAWAKLVKRIGSKCGIFKRHFVLESYQRFFETAGYHGEYMLAEGRIPCAIAVMIKK